MNHRMLIAVLLLSGALGAQDAVSKSLRANLTQVKNQITGVANEMPEDKYSFKATPAQRTFADQLIHLAEANHTLFARMEGAQAAKVEHPTAKADILKVLAASFEYADGVLAKLTDAQATETIKVGQNETTRLRTAVTAVANVSNHYGQLVVYLRLNGGAPPSARPR